MFWRITEFFRQRSDGSDELMFLAVRCAEDGKHVGRVEGSAPRDSHALALVDGQRSGLPEWRNPYGR